MFFWEKIGCRIFQAGFRLALPLLPYREPEIVESCEELGKVLKNENIKSVLILWVVSMAHLTDLPMQL